jgi:hypothetical protein
MPNKKMLSERFRWASDTGNGGRLVAVLSHIIIFFEKMKSSDPYFITHRIDWARSRLEKGQPFNSTYLMAEFEITRRTAMRDIRYIRVFYGDRLQYDYRDRMYFLWSVFLNQNR